ncbi:MAG: DUF6442 family protein [Solirubrobacterales bacterium]
MNKDEILSSIIKNAPCEDEREQYINDKARAIASTCFLLVLSLMMAYKAFKGINSSDLISIFLTFISVESLYKYYQYKSKYLLIGGIFTAICAVVSIIAFFFNI